MDFMLLVFGLTILFYVTNLVIIGLIGLIFYKPQDPDIILDSEPMPKYNKEEQYSHHIDERV